MIQKVILQKTTSDTGESILFLSIKQTINIVITPYIVYDDICLMVWKINYFSFILFIYQKSNPSRETVPLNVQLLYDTIPFNCRPNLPMS